MHVCIDVPESRHRQITECTKQEVARFWRRTDLGLDSSGLSRELKILLGWSTVIVQLSVPLDHVAAASDLASIGLIFLLTFQVASIQLKQDLDCLLYCHASLCMKQLGVC